MCLLTVLLGVVACTPGRAQDFPRIANLWGASPASRDYDQWARYDLLVLAGGSLEDWRRFREGIRARNPGTRLLDTAPLMNLGAPRHTSWMRDEWYLRRPDGELANWWAGQAYVPNLFVDPCLDALVAQTVTTAEVRLREGLIDGLFYDSVVGAVTWLGDVDTDRDGHADVPGAVNARWQERQNLFFRRLRERWPTVLILANDVDQGHAAGVNGRLFEGAPLLERVASGAMGVGDAVRALNTWMTASVWPPITVAIMTHPLGGQGWRVGQGDKVTTPGELDRARRDFRRMRLGLATTLMSDAYFAYDLGTVWYGLPWWYAEYDAPLGQPLGPAEEVFDVPPVTVLDWRAGQAPEALAVDAASHITPEGVLGEVADPAASWCRLFGTDHARLSLEPGKSYRIQAECEVVRQPTGTFQFNVRTGRGGWENHDKAVALNAAPAGTSWTLDVTIVPDDFDDYQAEWHLLGAGALRLRRLTVTRVGQSYWRRRFSGGLVLANGTQRGFAVALPQPLRRLTDADAPRHVLEVDDAGPGFACQGAWERRSGEGFYYGAGYRVAAKAGDTAQWTFTAPAEDVYTLHVVLPKDGRSGRPGRGDVSDAAMYTVTQPAGGPSVVLDQRQGDGGWARLFVVPLRVGDPCTVVLRSGGAGPTAADALRAEGGARFNDGAVLERAGLAPLDGVILLNR